jgi:hypothetical protein
VTGAHFDPIVIETTPPPSAPTPGAAAAISASRLPTPPPSLSASNHTQAPVPFIPRAPAGAAAAAGAAASPQTPDGKDHHAERLSSDAVFDAVRADIFARHRQLAALADAAERQQAAFAASASPSFAGAGAVDGGAGAKRANRTARKREAWSLSPRAPSGLSPPDATFAGASTTPFSPRRSLLRRWPSCLAYGISIKPDAGASTALIGQGLHHMVFSGVMARSSAVAPVHRDMRVQSTQPRPTFSLSSPALARFTAPPLPPAAAAKQARRRRLRVQVMKPPVTGEARKRQA